MSGRIVANKRRMLHNPRLWLGLGRWCAVRSDGQSAVEPAVYSRYYAEDEISLYEMFAVLRRRLVMMLAIAVAGLLLAAVYLFASEPVYESRAVIQVGLVGGMQDISDDLAIEAGPLLVKRLEERYQVDDPNGRLPLPRIERVRRDKNNGDVLEIVARAHSAQAAQGFLQGVVDTLLAEHDVLFTAARQLVDERLIHLREVKATIDNALVELDQRIQALAQNDTSTAALLALEKSRLIEQSLITENRLTGLDMMQQLKLQPSRSLRAPTLPETPTWPKPILIMSLAFVASLFAATVLAFFAEFLANNRQRASQDNAETPA